MNKLASSDMIKIATIISAGRDYGLSDEAIVKLAVQVGRDAGMSELELQKLSVDVKTSLLNKGINAVQGLWNSAAGKVEAAVNKAPKMLPPKPAGPPAVDVAAAAKKQTYLAASDSAARAAAAARGEKYVPKPGASSTPIQGP